MKISGLFSFGLLLSRQSPVRQGQLSQAIRSTPRNVDTNGPDNVRNITSNKRTLDQFRTSDAEPASNMRRNLSPVEQGQKAAADDVRRSSNGSDVLRANNGSRNATRTDEAIVDGSRAAQVETPAVRRVVNVGTDPRQLQAKFKHAGDFGITGNANKQSQAAFGAAIQRHLTDPATQVIQGTYRGNPVTHYFDSKTGLNVMVDSANNFVSGWKLSAAQIENVTTSGRLGGAGK